MNSIYIPQQKIVERIVRNENGQVFRAYFAISEIGGRFHAKLISAELISDANVKVETCCLSAGIQKAIFEIELEFSQYEKPNFIKDLFFFNSQPTRAPSL